MPGAGCSTAVPIGAEVAACPFTTSTLLRIATVSPGTATRRLISRTPSLGEEKVTMSPRRGSPRWATTMSVSGTFRSKASRLTSTTSPSSSVGRIDPDGMGFQSATAVRKRPKSTRKTMKPLLFRIHLGMPGPRCWFVSSSHCCYRPGSCGLVLTTRDARRRAAHAGVSSAGTRVSIQLKSQRLGEQRGTRAQRPALPDRLETFLSIEAHCRSITASGLEMYGMCAASPCPLDGRAQQHASKSLTTELGGDPHLVDVHKRGVRRVDLRPSETGRLAIYLADQGKIET